MLLWLFETLLVLYRVMKENAPINQRKIECPLENTLQLVFVALKSSLFVEQFQMKYDQLP